MIWLDRVRPVTHCLAGINLNLIMHQFMSSLNPAKSLYGRALRRLRTLSRSSGILPSSFTVRNNFSLSPDYSVFSSSYSDVHCARRSQLVVAFKVIRVHVDELEATERVRSLSPLSRDTYISISLNKHSILRQFSGAIYGTETLSRSLVFSNPPQGFAFVWSASGW